MIALTLPLPLFVALVNETVEELRRYPDCVDSQAMMDALNSARDLGDDFVPARAMNSDELREKYGADYEHPCYTREIWEDVFQSRDCSALAANYWSWVAIRLKRAAQN